MTRRSRSRACGGWLLADGLVSIKAAAPAGARLVAFELVVPDGAEPHMAKMIDLTMLGMLTGRERTQAEYRTLLEQAGFKFEGVAATPTLISVITALASPGPATAS
jgi:hypothetical protein